jgi:hypothetical protein
MDLTERRVIIAKLWESPNRYLGGYLGGEDSKRILYSMGDYLE